MLISVAMLCRITYPGASIQCWVPTVPVQVCTFQVGRAEMWSLRGWRGIRGIPKYWQSTKNKWWLLQCSYSVHCVYVLWHDAFQANWENLESTRPKFTSLPAQRFWGLIAFVSITAHWSMYPEFMSSGGGWFVLNAPFPISAKALPRGPRGTRRRCRS